MCSAFIHAYDKVSRSTSSLFSLPCHVWWAGWPTGDRHVSLVAAIRRPERYNILPVDDAPGRWRKNLAPTPGESMWYIAAPRKPADRCSRFTSGQASETMFQSENGQSSKDLEWSHCRSLIQGEHVVVCVGDVMF
jgi:hypothetical protein